MQNNENNCCKLKKVCYIIPDKKSDKKIIRTGIQWNIIDKINNFINSKTKIY